MENNNYSSLVFGKQPLNLISKPNEINTILSDCRGNKPINYIYLLTDVRGSGKTNLLANIANLLRSDEDWIVVDPRSKDKILENIASEICDQVKMKHVFFGKRV